MTDQQQQQQFVNIPLQQWIQKEADRVGGGVGEATVAAIGGIVGNSVGGGKGSQVAAVIGAVAGGLAGAAAEEGLTKSQGVELVIRLDKNNKTISLVQGHSPDRPFYIGDKVRLMTINGQTRVAR